MGKIKHIKRKINFNIKCIICNKRFKAKSSVKKYCDKHNYNKKK